MFNYQPVHNHDDLLNVVDGLLQEAGLVRADLDGQLSFAGMDPIRPTRIKVGSVSAAVISANAIASAVVLYGIIVLTGPNASILCTS